MIVPSTSNSIIAWLRDTAWSLASFTFQRFVGVVAFADEVLFVGIALLAAVARLADGAGVVLVDLTFVLELLFFMVFTFDICD